MIDKIEIFELQIDEKPNGFVIRLNDPNKCVFRICQIPKQLIQKSLLQNETIDITFPKNK